MKIVITCDPQIDDAKEVVLKAFVEKLAKEGFTEYKIEVEE